MQRSTKNPDSQAKRAQRAQRAAEANRAERAHRAQRLSSQRGPDESQWRDFCGDDPLDIIPRLSALDLHHYTPPPGRTETVAPAPSSRIGPAEVCPSGGAGGRIWDQTGVGPWSEADDLVHRKRAVADNVTACIVRWLDRRLDATLTRNAQLTLAGESSSAGRSTAGAQGRKRAAGNDEGAGAASGESRRQGKQRKVEPPNRRAEGLKMACPFYKSNPQKYKQQRPCCGPGWELVHRIKEHLYGKHALPKYSCPRCSMRFEVESLLHAHAKAPEPCEVRELEPLDGLTEAQEKMLRSRKKDSRADPENLTEAQKWREMYKILFPSVSEKDIPSPYYEDSDLSRDELEGFANYLRRGLPPLVRRRLEDEVERELGSVAEGLRRRIVEMMPRLQLMLLRSYRNQEGDEAPQAEAAGPAGTPTTGSNGEPSGGHVDVDQQGGAAPIDMPPVALEDIAFFEAMSFWNGNGLLEG